MEYIFTSESVSEGHPDKICDQVSDLLVDYFLQKDPKSRLAIETMATTNRIIIAGEVKANFQYEKDELNQQIVNLIKEIGYDQKGFSWKNLTIDNYLHEQSSDISAAVDKDAEIGAGDQGIMFGYANDENEYNMPYSLLLSHKLLKNIAKDRKNNILHQLLPDMKSQFSVMYKDNKPVGIDAIIFSTQHQEDVTREQIFELAIPYMLDILPDKSWLPPYEKIHVNPGGNFIIGGPDGDCGLTGRKITVDSYGGMAPHGGGAFSGKDCSKVDRSVAYMARYLAKNLVNAGICGKALIQIAYGIGMKYPVAFNLDCYGTNILPLNDITKGLREIIDLSPGGVIKKLNLTQPIFRKTASYGHFGRDPESDGAFSWEKNDLVTDLKSYFKL